MAAFEYKNAEDVRNILKRHDVRYLFFGKSGAILFGYSDTTQDVDLFVEKRVENCLKLHFEDAWKRRVDKEGFPVAHIDAIIQSKEAANRQRDRESLPRLLLFREWLEKQR